MHIDCPACGSKADPGSAGWSLDPCPECGSAPRPGPLPGSFGPYRVLGLIGEGGMGVVYRAEDERTGEEVAVKTVRVRKRHLLHRIRREVQALARIRHPGLVRIIETGQSDGQPWYAMELLRGITLAEYFRGMWPGMHQAPGRIESGGDFLLVTDPTDLDDPERPDPPGPTAVVSLGDEAGSPTEATRVVWSAGPDLDVTASATGTTPGDGPGPPAGPLPDGQGAAGPSPEALREFLTLIARLCETLAYLHGEGIVHRDIKPQNVLIRPDGTPVLLDFGLAAYFGAWGRESLDRGCKVEGTPEYMSPEQGRAEFVDARADLYSVGCLLYEGAVGRVPFRAATPLGTLRAHLAAPPIPPRSLRDDVPEALDALILGLLAKKAGDRLGYAKDVVAALAAIGCDVGDWATDRPSRDYLYRPGFVGREGALAELERHIRRVVGRPGRAIFLRGQSGAGKTRAIMELGRRLERGGLTVVTCECPPVGTGSAGGGDDGPGVRAAPLVPFRALLQVVGDACLERGPDEAERLLGPRGPILAECEPALASLPGQDRHRDAPAEGGDLLGSSLIEALGETLSEFARDAPVVVLLDDLQWADELTLNFLALYHVGVWDRPDVAILAAYRSDEGREALKGYRPVFEDATFVDLEPLGEGCLAAIVRDMLGSHEPDDRFVEHLARRSRGNPFFVAEYLRAAVAEGLLRRDASGAWRLRPAEEGAEIEDVADSVALPGSLHDLVVRRLDGLSGDARRLLQLASVFGREVDPELLDAVGLLDDDAMLGAVEALLVAQVLEEGRDGRFRFAHDKLREVAYEQIPPGRRRALHRSAARAIERAGQGRDDPGDYPALAHHWYRSIGDRADDPFAASMAVDALEKSVIHAVNGGLPGEAIGFGRAAARLLGVDLPEDTPEVVEAMTDELGRIDRALGDRPPAALLDLPAAGDARADRVIGLLLRIHPPAYLSNQFGLFALMASKNLALTLEHGLGRLSPVVFAMFAIVARIIGDDARKASDFSALAIELDRRRGGAAMPDVTFLDVWFINHWVRPIREGLARADAGARAGLTPGPAPSSPLYGCLDHAAYVVLLAASGGPLPRVVAEADARLAAVGYRVAIARYHLILERQLALALRGRTCGPARLGDADFDEDRDLAFICRTSNANQAGYYHVARLKLHYSRGEHAEALASADRALAVWESFARQVVEVDLAFFRARALLALSAPGEVRPADLAAAREHLAALSRWRVDAEANFGHKAALVAAEVARVEGRPAEALAGYAEAARSAEAHGFAHHAALAFQLAANSLETLGDHAGSRAARAEAIRRYRAWGASAVADRLWK